MHLANRSCCSNNEDAAAADGENSTTPVLISSRHEYRSYSPSIIPIIPSITATGDKFYDQFIRTSNSVTIEVERDRQRSLELTAVRVI